MRITFHQLKVFKLVADCLSVTKAAEKLHMTQPAVSNILKQLESYFDCRLTEVIGRQLALTPFGEVVLRACRDVNQIIDDTKTELALMKGGVKGDLNIAGVTTTKYFLLQLLSAFKHEFPDIQLHVAIANRQEIINRLQQNLDNFAIMSHPPENSAFDRAIFYEDKLVVVAGIETFNQYKTRRLHLDDLKSATWLLREEGSGTRHATEKIFAKLGFNPQQNIIIGDSEAIKQAVIANMGITVISRQSISFELNTKRLFLLQVVGFPDKHHWYLIKHRQKELPPLADKFYHFVKSQTAVK